MKTIVAFVAVVILAGCSTFGSSNANQRSTQNTPQDNVYFSGR